MGVVTETPPSIVERSDEQKTLCWSNQEPSSIFLSRMESYWPTEDGGQRRKLVHGGSTRSISMRRLLACRVAVQSVTVECIRGQNVTKDALMPNHFSSPPPLPALNGEEVHK
ncbi:hypothetical protein CBL_08668 [Carabus blaptoides fortunei]